MDAVQNLFTGKNKIWSFLVIIAILLTAFLSEYDLIMHTSGSIANSSNLKKTEAALEDLASSNSKSISENDFKNITKQFGGSISAKTIITSIKEVGKKHNGAYASGTVMANTLTALSPESKKMVSGKVEKLIFTKDKITVKLKQGVPYIKLKNKTKKGKIVTIKINQGATINITEKSHHKLKAKIKGTLIWMSVNYADIGAIAVNTTNNTLSVFTKLGVGFWTNHKLGSVNRRYQ